MYLRLHHFRCIEHSYEQMGFNYLIHNNSFTQFINFKIIGNKSNATWLIFIHDPMAVYKNSL